MTETEKHRVAITGIGIITSLGTGIAHNFNEILASRSGIKPVDSFKSLYQNNLYAHITHCDVEAGFSEKEKRRTDRCYKLLEIAAQDAIHDANLNEKVISCSKVGLYLGSIMAGDQFAHKLHESILKKKQYQRNYAYLMPKHVYADLLARKLKLNGPRMLFSTACTASTLAISVAAESIMNGQIDFAFAGGSDPLSQYIFAGFHNMRNVSKEACAPFSMPEGMTLGEGAGFIVLENMSQALNRGARIYAELLGYAMTADAIHPTAPDLSGQSHKKLMEKAMHHSGVEKQEVDYINIHGTGTKANDKAESMGLSLVFGNDVQKVKISSIKGAVGHVLGGAGVVEAAITIMSLYKQQLIPNVGFKEKREGCEFNIVQKASKEKINIALSNNYAFGGNNACLVFARYNKKRQSNRPKNEVQSVVITGIGFLSPLGNNREALISGLKNHDKSISYCGTIPYFAVDDPKLDDIDGYDPRRADRLGKIIIAATQLAYNDAELSPTNVNMDSVGIISGTAYSHMKSNIAFNEMIVLGKPHLSNPVDFANSVANAGCGLASINLRAKGCNIAISTGHVSGMQSITLGYDLIKSGREDIVICGGADCLDDFLLKSMTRIFKTPSTSEISLLEQTLKGKTEKTLFGEGGCYFVLESAESAYSRNAPIYCEIEGYGVFSDYNTEKSLCERTQFLMEATMHDSLIKSKKLVEDINLVVRSDLLIRQQHIGEVHAINKVFGSTMPHMAFSPNFGISSILSPLSIASSIYINSKAKRQDRQNFYKYEKTRLMINSMSFGGCATSLVLSV